MTQTPTNQEQSPTPVRPDSPTFADLGARPETVEALAAVGITHAFAIQEYAIPIAMRGSDVIGQAPTGTGKTLGFGVPLLERVLAPAEGADGTPQALVVVPTRELCLQVASDLTAGGATRGVRVLAIYGGVAYEPQTADLRRGVEIVVGTPGRLLDLARQKQLKLREVRALVLDEADRMLDLGFLEDVEKILSMLPEQRQTMLFSATMPDPIVALSRRFLRSPMTLHAEHPGAAGAGAPQTRQVIYRTHSLNKVEIVARILQSRERGLTMVFSRTKRGVDKVAGELDFRGFACAAVHGDLGQSARERALRAFRSGKVDVLVATDVAARGLDVTGVTHVINYDCPEDPDAYTHRIGRTGRAGATGTAVTFVDWEDMARWRLIDKTLRLGTPEPPETYHTSEWLYADLDIPADATGVLPTAQRSRAGLGAEVEQDLGGRSGGRNERGERGERRRSDRHRDHSGSRSRERSGEAERSGERERSGDRPRKRTRRRVSGGPDGTSSGPDTSTGQPATTAHPESSPGSATGGEPPAERATSAGGGFEATTDSTGSRNRRRRRGGRGGAGRGSASTEPASEPTQQSAP